MLRFVTVIQSRTKHVIITYRIFMLVGGKQITLRFIESRKTAKGRDPDYV